MKKIDLKITIDIKTKRIDYVMIEGIKFDYTIFKFISGEWVAELKNLPTGADIDLDILIIAIGIPNTESKMNVFVDKKSQGEYKTFKPFNSNGYAFFKEEIKL